VEPALVNYRHSPHLAQWRLHDRLVGVLHGTISELSDAGLPPRVLEIGAGHGGYAGFALAAGCEVTVAEMSTPAFRDLEARYGANDRLTAVADPGATLSGVGDGFALAVCISVLHHIPDYLDLLRRVTARLLPGGALLTLQDPLWYPRVGRATRAVDRGAYLTWRVGQGNVGEGLAAMRRRLRGVYPEAKDEEIVYHHVVRQGVDERAVEAELAGRFSGVEVFPYWSNHLGAVHRAADAAGLANTFGVRATGYEGRASV
jgi:SAM-dependent methyltransferase